MNSSDLRASAMTDTTPEDVVIAADHDFTRGHGPVLRASHAMTGALGSPWAFSLATIFGAVWLGVGVLVNFSRTWELAGTLGIPFFALYALFALQHTQNHNDRAVQLKLDELLRALERADGRLVAVEDVDESGLQELRATYRSELIDDG